MNQQKSISINAIISGLRQIMSLVFPLITFPYVSGVLGVDNLGKFSFSHSIIIYFQLLSALGIATYAVREGAKYRDSRNKISLFASEVFSISVITTTISFLLLTIIIFTNHRLYEYKQILFLLSFIMIFNTFGCEWVYKIYEEYLYIAKRILFFQIVSLVLLFLFVRTKDDILVYTFIIVLSSSGANIVNALGLRKYCSISFCFSKKMWVHLLPMLILFGNSVTTTIYVSSGTTILGFLTSDYNVGIYSVAAKIYMAVKHILAHVILVSVPRLSYLWGQNSKIEFESLANKIFSALLIVVLPSMILLFCLSRDMILVLSTQSFISATQPLHFLSIALMFSLFSWFFTSSILIPCKREGYVLRATCIAALVNLALNFILVPYFKETGAAIATVFAELSSMLFCYFCSKDIIKISIKRNDIVSVFLGCIIIVIISQLVKYLNFKPFIYIVLTYSISAICYIKILLMMGNQTVCALKNGLVYKMKMFRS